MLREKEIEYFRKNVLPYYIQQIEEEKQLERIYQEREEARIKHMREVEEAKRLKREKKLQEKEAKRLKKEQEKQILKEQKRLERERQKQLQQEKAQIKAEKQLLKMEFKQEKAKIIREQRELLKQNIETQLEKLEVFKEKSLQNLIEDGSEETRLASGKYKRCSKCGKVLKLTEFYKHPLKKQGVFDYCKTCACIKQMQYRKSKIERKENQQEILQRMLA